ncbi:MAG: hypothetical protein ACJAYJ_004179 [Saprospiraceae bacterium]|jgi:hypothetical protein
MTNFKNMPLHSRVWIYQSIREFSENEIAQLKTKAERFISEWTSHGKTMSACIEIFYNRFIIVCVDEKTISASGCGIDKSVKFIQQLESDLGENTSLLDRMNVAYRQNAHLNGKVGQGKIISCHISEFKNLLTFPEGQKGITVFNNLVNTKEELEQNWEVPMEESWQYEKLKLT